MPFKNSYIAEVGRMSYSTLLYGLLCLWTSLPAEAIVVSIKNDLSKEEEGRILEIDHIQTPDAPKSHFRISVYPDEEKSLAAGSITHFTLSRVFPTHKLKYEVTCLDSDIEKTFTVRELHENQLGDECRLVRFGHWSRRTGMQWTHLSANPTPLINPSVTPSINR